MPPGSPCHVQPQSLFHMRGTRGVGLPASGVSMCVTRGGLDSPDWYVQQQHRDVMVVSRVRQQHQLTITDRQQG